MLSRLRLFKILIALVFLVSVVVVTVVLTSTPEPESSFDRSGDSQVISALERTGEVSLITAHTSGVYEVENHTVIFGKRLPGSAKTVFIEYSYENKLGFDASAVNIKPKHNNEYQIIIPEFILIGKNNIEVETVFNTRGPISFSTENIDVAKATEEILASGKGEELIESNRDLLEDGAEEFYEDIILEFDDEVRLDYRFK